MSSLNPFLEDDVASTHSATATKETVSVVRSSTPISQTAEWSLDDIAEDLLKNKYVLTALELYTEIQERGKESNRLRNYFSNPTNFEQQVPVKDGSGSELLYRTTSSSTFDSLDMARYSDDGFQVDEKVAVLEFELRKAKDTIKSLRSNLTKTAEQQSPSLHDKYYKNNGKNKLINSSSQSEEIKPLEMRAINFLINEYLLKHGYKLSSITFADENEEQDFEDWDDVGLNTPKPPELLLLYRDFSNHTNPKVQTCEVSTSTDGLLNDVTDKDSSLVEEFRSKVEDITKANEELQLNIQTLEKEALAMQKKITDQLLSAAKENNSLATSTNTDATLSGETASGEDIASFQPDAGRMSAKLWSALLLESQLTIEDSWLKDEVLSVTQTSDELVFLLSRCLPHIVPTVLLAKRDQLIPLLLSSAALHPDLSIRNDLLHILFNLIKKPDDAQRQTILHGCTAYAKHVGSHRTEEELLPQCWEQIGHKYAERRHLVAEACGAIAPYLRSEMRGSLLISILHQMQQEEKVDSIRCSVAHSLAIIYALLDDEDKYDQAYELLRSFLNDKSLSVRQAAYCSLLPSFAIWSVHRRTVHSYLFDALLKRLERMVEEQKEDDCLSEIIPITYLLPYLFAAMLLEIKDDDCSEERVLSESRFSEFKRDLENPRVIVGDDERFARLVSKFDDHVSAATIDSDAQVLLWVTHQLIPRLLKVFELVNPIFEETVSSLTEMMEMFVNLFGKNYIEEKVDLQFTNVLETSVERYSTSLVPVYVTSLLTVCEDNRVDLHEFLFTTIVRLALSNLPDESIKVTLALLRNNTKYHDSIAQVLWSAVMHDAPSVRCSAASLLVTMTTARVDDRLLTTRILPAIITLSTDADVNVRIASISTFCLVMMNPSINLESVERVTTQLAETVASSVEGFDDEQSQDGTILGLHTVRLILLNLTTKLGAVVYPKFRDEFILPHLVAIAASNNQTSDTTKRSLVALAMLEAYTCLSCCFISTSLLQGSVLPALKCLQVDVEDLHPEHADEVSTLIIEAERKLEQGSVTSDDTPHPLHLPTTNTTGSLFSGSHLGQAVSTGADDAKRKILTTWGQLKAKAPSSPPIFPWKKEN